MIEKIQALIEQFLSGKYDALKFSYDLEDMIVDNYAQLSAEDPDLAKKLDDTFPEICSEFEHGADVEPFRRKILDAFTALYKIEELDTVVIVSDGKVGTVVNISTGEYTVEWCNDELPAGEADKWRLYECNADEIRLLHKGAMRKEEPAYIKL
ncbi:hypothetical protein [Butyrivibrio sp.]|uniref:hypothetical protein n=1 Tax=Butyrivibrio sp. TaxID=28121 RepID=UPI0025C31465|nr:hypothetical protein [Butyrivibrio sp.]MBQ9305184.1 hypothetical protein [Butyrivibrio sp.]